LFVIEDCCDAHGSLYNKKKVGSFGDMGCFSFYAAHAMTMGEGGAITINDLLYGPILRSLKTCGRACACRVCRVTLDPNYNCPLRTDSKIEGFENFDKRALYINIGYKLKILDLQSAFGIEQLKKLPFFIRRRTENFEYITKALKKWENYLILPKATPNSSPDWFSIPLTVSRDAPFKKDSLVNWLEKHNIETRPLLGGNIIKHPAYKNIKYRATNLKSTNFFHESSFYIGCYPGLTEQMLKYIIQTFDEFFKNLKPGNPS
jgi:CDP-6-deoxy-D-xylo-4-hexulose-3-dehydrase